MSPDTATAERVPVAVARTGRRRRVAIAAAGPALIALAVVLVLHDVALNGMVSAQHPDPLAWSLPSHCFLGTSLAGGTVPGWNPHVLGGTPFVADAQSGWMNLPAMALYLLFSCSVAMRMYILVMPLIAGLGAYWFLRLEGASRPAATIGGMLLSLGIAGSALILSFPFAGALAWTPVVLGAASRYFRASAWGGRLAWAAVAAVAWGQVGAAHLSNGLATATGALLFYAAAKSWASVRSGRTTVGQSAARVVALFAVLPLVNLALLLPRVAYLRRSTLGLGYEGLADLGRALRGRPPQAEHGVGLSTGYTWPLIFSASPGTYFGALGLGLSLAWWRARGRRGIPLALFAYGLVSYVVGLRVVAEIIGPVVRQLPLGTFYTHGPWRFRLGVFLVIPFLAAFGLDAWRRADGPRERLLMLAPGVVLWFVLPAFIAHPQRLVLLGVGAVAAAVALTASLRRPALVVALPAVLAAELVANGLLGQAAPKELVQTGIQPAAITRPFTPMLQPSIDAAAYVAEGPIVEALRGRGGRYVSFDPSRRTPKGYLGSQDADSWGLMTNQRATLFGLEDAQGYNPAQLLRYWMFTRALNERGIKYNSAVFTEITPPLLEELNVVSVVGPLDDPPPLTDAPVASDGRWAVFPVAQPVPRASLHTDWTVVDDEWSALAAVTATTPEEPSLVLETDPGIDPQPDVPGGTARYSADGTQAARVEIEAPVPAVLLVRNVHDRYWRASIDGREVDVLRGNFLVQAIPVPAGRHTVVLEYDDPWIGLGLLGSAAAIASLGLAAFVLRRRRERQPAPPTTTR